MITINDNPRLTFALNNTNIFQESPLVVVDVGASGGFENQWNAYGHNCKLIGFEPDINECSRLNLRDANKNKMYCPAALSHSKGKKLFYKTREIYSSGLLRADTEMSMRFEDNENGKFVALGFVDTCDYDSFALDNKLPKANFMKLDTEGSELDILKGAEAALYDSVLGISLEMLFQKWRISQPVFSEIDLYLRSKGFMLYDFTSQKYARKVLPPYPTTWRMKPYGGGNTPTGQVIAGDFLYFRDPIQEVFSGDTIGSGWDPGNILKLASLYELYNLNDCAVELILFALEYKLIPGNFEVLLDFLVPPVNGQFLSYQQYLEVVKM
jgi:FkbM family methyltransferase